MGELPQQLIVQAALILLNAFFAATEIAVISLNTAKLRRLQETGDKTAGRLLRMAEEPAGFLSTIQIGITLAGFLGSAFAAENFSDSLTNWIYNGLGFQYLPVSALDTVSVIVITIILSYFTLIFGELVPKRIAMQKPYEVAKIASGPVSAIAFGMKPVIGFLAFSTNTMLKLLHRKVEAEEEQVTEDEIGMIIDLGKENGAIDEEETEWLQNVFEFNDTPVQEAMTRDFEVESFQIGDTEEEIVEKIRETGLSRFPVYDKDGRDILGILYSREYLLNLRTDKKPLGELLHQPYFVPETMHADQLFGDMQKKKIHMAIVIDEYGEISGIITMEDLLEEIVGNIYDEFDAEEEPEIEQMDDNLWRFPGSTLIRDVSETLGMTLPEQEDYETVGGLVLSCLNTIPADGTTLDVETEGLSIHVEQIKNRRIESVLVKKLEQKQEEDEVRKTG